MKKQTFYSLLTLTLLIGPGVSRAEILAPVTNSSQAELSATQSWVVANVCGNGIVEEGEACDGGSNCSANCKGGMFHGNASGNHPELGTQPGYEFTPQTQAATPSDSGTADSPGPFHATKPELKPQGTGNPGNAGGAHELSPLDKPEFAPVAGAAKCGNGTLESGEACDDGNTVAGDGCNGSCQAESPAERGPLADRTGEDSSQVTSTALPMLQGGCTLQSWTANPAGATHQTLVGLALLLPAAAGIARKRR